MGNAQTGDPDQLCAAENKRCQGAAGEGNLVVDKDILDLFSTIQE